MKHEQNEVVITGVGLVTPLGNTAKETWQSVVNGKSGITCLDHFDTSNHSCKVAGFVKNEQPLLDNIFPAAKQRKSDRFIHLAVLAAHEAMKDANLTKEFPSNRDRFGSYFGVGIGGLSTFIEGGYIFKEHGPKKISPFLLLRAIMNEAPAWVSLEWNLQGPMLALCNACASGTDAVGMAAKVIRNGDADYMIAGGTESCTTGPSFSSFDNMRALSSWKGDPTQASRPFDRDRSGFVMSEGAAVLVLERKDLALKRGAEIYAEIVGYGSAADAFHLAAIHPEGRGGISSIKKALNDANINPSDIDYINAHGTATPMNDPAETKIIKSVFGDHAKKLMVSSTKSMTGHMLGATGAAEAAFCALAIKNGIVPPTINLDNPDINCDLDYVPKIARDHEINYALSNSFGFGGGNAVIALKKNTAS